MTGVAQQLPYDVLPIQMNQDYMSLISFFYICYCHFHVVVVMFHNGGKLELVTSNRFDRSTFLGSMNIQLFT